MTESPAVPLVLRQSRAGAGMRSGTFGMVTMGAIVTGAVVLGACANPSGTLVIVQNQQPISSSMSALCTVSSDSMVSGVASGLFDVDLDQPYRYWVYPLVQSRLPSIKTSGDIERNSLALQAVRVTIKAPGGVDPGWDDRCPGIFDSPATAVLDPGQARALAVEGFRTCHSTRLRQLIADGVIPGDQAQPVYFTLELTAVADRSGSEVLSDPFPFQVQICAGCLQSMFPLTPTCADAPKPNPLPGNPCNIAQDGPQVLCCKNPGGALICPAPSI